MEQDKAMEFTILQTDKYMMGNGKMIYNMERVNTLVQMVSTIKDFGWMIKRMDMGFNMLLMETNSNFGKTEY